MSLICNLCWSINVCSCSCYWLTFLMSICVIYIFFFSSFLLIVAIVIGFLFLLLNIIQRRLRGTQFIFCNVMSNDQAIGFFFFLAFSNNLDYLLLLFIQSSAAVPFLFIHFLVQIDVHVCPSLKRPPLLDYCIS